MSGQVFLTAVAISYIVCVLLLSGLQTEDLDANTLERLQQHNVNIDDNKKESLSQMCLLKSSSDIPRRASYDIVEDHTDALVTPVNIRYYKEDLRNKDTRALETIESNKYVTDNFIAEYTSNEIKTSNADQSLDVKNKMSNNLQIKSDQERAKVKENYNRMSYFKGQSSLKRALNLWNEMSGKTTTGVSVSTVTSYPTHVEYEINSSTPRSQNSREMKYVNRIISEYLENQTSSRVNREELTPTTTIKPKIDLISEKIKEFLAQQMGGIKSVKDLCSTAASQKTENNYEKNVNTKEISDRDRMTPMINDNNYLKKKDPRLYSLPDENKCTNNEQLERLPFIYQINDSRKMLNNDGQVPKKEMFHFRDDILRFNKIFNFNKPISHSVEIIRSEEYNNNKKAHELSNNNVQYDIGAKRYNNIHINNEQNNRTTNLVGGISADVIKVIAENVKEVVIKDLRRGMPPTYLPISPTSTTTNAPTTNSVNEDILTQLQEETQEKSEVIQTLIGILKIFQTLKENNQPITEKQLKVSNSSLHTNSPVMTYELNPQKFKSSIVKIEQRDLNPYSHSLLAVSNTEDTENIPQANLYPKSEHRLSPITIQTNSDQIPPLAIQISNKNQLYSQNIDIITLSPLQNKKKGEPPRREIREHLNGKLMESLNTGDDKKHINHKTFDDLTNKLSIANTVDKTFRNSYKDRIQKLQNRFQYAHEQKLRLLDHPSQSHHQVGVGQLVTPTGYRLDQNIGTSHGSMSQQLGINYHKNLYQPLDPKHGSLNYNSHQRNTFDRPVDSMNHGNWMASKYPDNLSRLEDRTYSASYNQLANANYKPLNPTLESYRPENFNQPLEPKYHQRLSQNSDLSQYEIDARTRDVITNEVLNRLVDSNHRNVISRLVQSSLNEVLNGQTNHNYDNHYIDGGYAKSQHDAYPKRTKFHERLEQIDNVPPNNYKYYNSKFTTQAYRDTVAPRQQMPLNTMNQQRAGFDNTHFRNFLKSQQKVTDMLEKILALKTTDFQSVESL